MSSFAFKLCLIESNHNSGFHKMERSEISCIIEKHKKNINFRKLYIIDFISDEILLFYSSNSTDIG